jgi:hypothetical protein
MRITRTRGVSLQPPGGVHRRDSGSKLTDVVTSPSAMLINPQEKSLTLKKSRQYGVNVVIAPHNNRVLVELSTL